MMTPWKQVLRLRRNGLMRVRPIAGLSDPTPQVAALVCKISAEISGSWVSFFVLTRLAPLDKISPSPQRSLEVIRWYS
jgi:hypothetical protein